MRAQSTKTSDGSPTDTMRQRIVETSKALLAEEGLKALSMREVARRLGLTHQAPYHYFPDRESILAELVTQGFDELTERLAHSGEATQSKDDLLLASSEAYVGFALDNPGVFRIMFRPDICDLSRFPLAREAGDRARVQLEHLARSAHEDLTDLEAIANLYWGCVHGLACLFVDGPLGLQFSTKETRLSHLKKVIQSLLALRH